MAGAACRLNREYVRFGHHTGDRSRRIVGSTTSKRRDRGMIALAIACPRSTLKWFEPRLWVARRGDSFDPHFPVVRRAIGWPAGRSVDGVPRALSQRDRRLVPAPRPVHGERRGSDPGRLAQAVPAFAEL